MSNIGSCRLVFKLITQICKCTYKRNCKSEGSEVASWLPEGSCSVINDSIPLHAEIPG